MERFIVANITCSQKTGNENPHNIRHFFMENKAQGEYAMKAGTDLYESDRDIWES
jgi:hypothetical protein